MLYQVIILLLTVILLVGFSIYLHYNGKLKEWVSDYIDEAEEEYDGLSTGEEKFEWVVDSLLNLIPSPFRILFPKTTVAALVQNTFDIMEAYAVKQRKKLYLPWEEASQETFSSCP